MQSLGTVLTFSGTFCDRDFAICNAKGMENRLNGGNSCGDVL